MSLAIKIVIVITMLLLIIFVREILNKLFRLVLTALFFAFVISVISAGGAGLGSSLVNSLSEYLFTDDILRSDAILKGGMIGLVGVPILALFIFFTLAHLINSSFEATTYTDLFTGELITTKADFLPACGCSIPILALVLTSPIGGAIAGHFISQGLMIDPWDIAEKAFLITIPPSFIIGLIGKYQDIVYDDGSVGIFSIGAPIVVFELIALTSVPSSEISFSLVGWVFLFGALFGLIISEMIPTFW